MGALMAIEDINKAGGIKSLGGAKIEAMLGDAQSSPQAGTAEIEKMNEAGVSAVVGAFASAICLATTQAAAKYNLPHVVDVGVADQIVERGLKNTFPLWPWLQKVRRSGRVQPACFEHRRRQARSHRDDRARRVLVRHRHRQLAV